jgi:hypothetical protein
MLYLDKEIVDNPVTEDIRSHLATVMNGAIYINVGHQEDGRACLKLQTLGANTDLSGNQGDHCCLSHQGRIH